MAKPTKKSSRKATAITVARTRDSAGKILLHRYVDANSATFSADFDSIFRANVRKARRANKLIVGVADRAVGKS